MTVTLEKIGLTSRELTLLESVFQQYAGLKSVRLFGSRAMGTHKPSSDVDLALLGHLTPTDVARVQAALDELPLPYFFDVVDVATITYQPFRDHIDTCGRLIYAA
jgi:uncharacterized protein